MSIITMAHNEERARQLVAEAEMKLSMSRKFVGFLFGDGRNVEDAVECYQKAANLYKISKNWTEAGRNFCKAARLQIAERKFNAATNYVDAGNCYKKCDINEAIKCLIKAIDLYTDMGKFTTAARHHQAIAEMYEKEIVDLENAIQHYEIAGDYFRGEESNSSANKCLLKVAEFSAQMENYDRAIQIYDQVATASLDNRLLKYSCTDYMFRAGLCHMCVDFLNAQHAMDRYVQMHPAFQDSREYKLLKTLAECIEEQDGDGFAEAVKNYDSITRLDQWYTSILLRIKKQLSDHPDLR